MGSHQFSTAGSLSKQKEKMAETICLGRCREAEQHILKAVSFSPGLKGNYKVEMDPGSFDKIRVSFSSTNGEEISKRVDSFKEANDWLLLKCEAFKQGTLSQGLRELETDAKPQVALEKEADKLVVAEGQGLEAALGSKPSLVPSETAVDVTADFLSTTAEAAVPLPDSMVCLHKGNLKTFINLVYSNRSTYGVLYGKVAWNGKFHATNIVLRNDHLRAVSSLTGNKRYADHFSGLSKKCCGIVLAGERSFWEQEKNQREALEGLVTGVDPILILVSFDKKISGEFIGLADES